jgi:hypothetical protein
LFLFLFFFLSLFIQVATFYSLHPSYQLEKFCSELIIGIIRPANETLIKYYRCIGLFYHKFCTKNWLCFCDQLCQIAVNIQNRQSCGKIYPICVGYLSKTCTDV